MKFWLYLFVFLFAGNTASQAQKYDYNWMAGYGSTLGFDSNYLHWFGTSKLDFRQTPVAVNRDSLRINFGASNSTISDKDGNLLFYCNGVRVHNSIDEKMENGDSLSVRDSSYYLLHFQSSAFNLGLPLVQYHIALPNPIDDNLFELFYSYIDSIHLPNSIVTYSGKKILRATIDISANNGQGKVLAKDSIISYNYNNYSVAAVRHGDGRCWWVVSNISNTNCYLMTLYNGTDSFSHKMQCGGNQTDFAFSIYQRFSPDGNLFVTFSQTGELNIFDFDRCVGELSLREHISIRELSDSSGWTARNIEFSPDGRYLYVACIYRIFQFDMTANSIAGSRFIIGRYNNAHLCPFEQSYEHLQLAPDGKIYMSAGSTNYCVGVIDNPNAQGSSCNFNDTALELPTFIDGLPYYPNYRLGALPGSPCDTITGLNDVARADKEKLLKVFPNPATNFVTIDYGFTDWNKGEVSLEITNELGQMVHQQPVPMYSGFQKVEVQNFAPGMYTAFIKRKGQVVATAKFAKQ
jgi:hypothetical protein